MFELKSVKKEFFRINTISSSILHFYIKFMTKCSYLVNFKNLNNGLTIFFFKAVAF